MPSLIINLLAVSSNVSFPKQNALVSASAKHGQMADSILKCHPKSFVLNRFVRHDEHVRVSIKFEIFRSRWNPGLMASCDFPGHKVFSVVYNVSLLSDSGGSSKKQAANSGWLTPYNIRHNFTSNWRARATLEAVESASDALEMLESTARQEMGSIFEPPTVSEWIEQIIRPLRERAKKRLVTLR